MKLHLLAIAVLAAGTGLATAQTGGYGGSTSDPSRTTTPPAGKSQGTSGTAHGNEAMDTCKTMSDPKAREDCMKAHTPAGNPGTTAPGQKSGSMEGKGDAGNAAEGKTSGGTGGAGSGR